MKRSVAPISPDVGRQTLAKKVLPARLYLREWLRAKGKRQAAITAELGWEPGRVSKIASGRQPYTGADLAVLAKWLDVHPHELLLPPDEALGFRRLRAAAEEIVGSST